MKESKSKKKSGGFLGLLVIIIIIVIAAALLFGGFGFGFGTGSGSGDGEGDGTSENSAAPSDNTEAPEEEVTEETTDISEEDYEEGTVVQVSVVKSEYFYENKSISLSDLMEVIAAIEGKLVVEITDDNAALKAYNKLIDALEDKEIRYIEVGIN